MSVVDYQHMYVPFHSAKVHSLTQRLCLRHLSLLSSAALLPWVSSCSNCAQYLSSSSHGTCSLCSVMFSPIAYSALHLSHDRSLDKRCPIRLHNSGAWLSSLRAISWISNTSICSAHAFCALKCHPLCLWTSSIILAMSDRVKSPAENSTVWPHSMGSLANVSKITGHSARNSILLAQSEYIESDKKKTIKYFIE